jgi:hypothetical protein
MRYAEHLKRVVTLCHSIADLSLNCIEQYHVTAAILNHTRYASLINIRNNPALCNNILPGLYLMNIFCIKHANLVVFLTAVLP